jgi:predicted XRE-type DNA-binding protein
LRAIKKATKAKSAYQELGFSDAGEMLVKAKLVLQIAEILRDRNWSQQHAAKVLGMTQPKLSKMLRGQFRGVSEMKMMDCLVRLGREVKIVVGPERKKTAGRLDVVAA